MEYQRKSGDVGTRTFGATIVLAGGRLLTKGFSLLNLVVLARMLAPEDYGIVALAFTILAILYALCETGTSTLLIVQDDIARSHLDTAFTIHVLRGLAVSLVLVAGAYPLAFLLDDAQLAPVFLALAATPIIGGFANPGLQMYTRNLDFRREVVRDILAAGAASLFAIAAAIHFRNYWALVIGAVASSLIQTALTYWRIPYRPSFSLSEWRGFAAFGKWIMAERIVAQITGGAPQLVFWAFSTPAMLGIYTVAKNVQSIPLSEMLEPIRRSLLPGLATFSQDRIGLRRAFRKAQAVIAGFALPIGVMMALMAQEIILVLVGREWVDAIIVLQILSPFLAMKAAIGPVTNVAMISDGMLAIFTRAVWVTALTYPILALSIWWGDLTGAAIGLAILAMIRLVLHGMLAKRMIDEPVFGLFVNAWRSFLAVAVMAAIVFALPIPFDPVPFDAQGSIWHAALSGGLKALCGTAVYLTTHFALWVLAGKPDGFESTVIRYGSLAVEIAKSRLGLSDRQDRAAVPKKD